MVTVRTVRTVFVDTWGWIAFASKTDRDHETVRPFLEDLFSRDAVNVITSGPVIGEMLANLSHPKVKAYMKAAEGSKHPSIEQAARFRALIRDEQVEVQYPAEDEYLAALQIFKKFNDQSLSLVDCLTIHYVRKLKFEEVVGCDEAMRRAEPSIKFVPKVPKV